MIPSGLLGKRKECLRKTEEEDQDPRIRVLATTFSLFSYLSRSLISKVLSGTHGAVALDPLDAVLGTDGGDHAECIGQVLQRDYRNLRFKATVLRPFYKKFTLAVFSLPTRVSTPQP